MDRVVEAQRGIGVELDLPGVADFGEVPELFVGERVFVAETP